MNNNRDKSNDDNWSIFSFVKDGNIALLSLAGLLLTINFGIVSFSETQNEIQVFLDSTALFVGLSGIFLFISLISGVFSMLFLFYTINDHSSIRVNLMGYSFFTQFGSFIIGMGFLLITILVRINFM